MKNPENPISDWMQQLGSDPVLQARSLPDPDLLWMKAQYLDRLAAQERALKPADCFAMVARVLVGFAVCWVVLSLTKSLEVPVATKIDPVWLSLGAAVILSGAVLALYSIWVDWVGEWQ